MSKGEKPYTIAEAGKIIGEKLNLKRPMDLLENSIKNWDIEVEWLIVPSEKKEYTQIRNWRKYTNIIQSRQHKQRHIRQSELDKFISKRKSKKSLEI